MTRHRDESKSNLYHLAAHVPEDIYLKVRAIADREDRSLSYVAKRLLLKGWELETNESGLDKEQK